MKLTLPIKANQDTPVTKLATTPLAQSFGNLPKSSGVFQVPRSGSHKVYVQSSSSTDATGKFKLEVNINGAVKETYDITLPSATGGGVIVINDFFYVDLIKDTPYTISLNLVIGTNNQDDLHQIKVEEL